MLFGIRTKMNKYADAALERQVPAFANSLGEAGKNGAGYVFPPPAGPGSSLRLCYRERRKFLGGVFALTMEATAPTSAKVLEQLRAAGPLRLRYKGALLKGAALFTARKDTACSLLLMLNKDAKLLELLAKQDVERLEISADDDVLRISLTPVGGAYTYMVLPPLRYAVALPKGHEALMAGSMHRLLKAVAAA